MLQFIGYDFFGGYDCLREPPTNVSNINSSEIRNAIFDHFSMSKDTTLPFDKEKPIEWTYDTILNAPLDGNLFAGNLNYLLSNVSSIKIKRREKGSFDWITIHEQKVENLEDLTFAFNDFLNAYGVEYDYALVPILGSVEGNYVIDSVLSKFNGVFIGTSEESYKFLYDVQYGSNARNQQTSTFAPLGRKYPIIVANGVMSYESGSVSGTILNNSFEKDGKLDRVEIVKKKDKIKDFLTNKKPKILKDWNGNLWLILVTDKVDIGYAQGSGMGIPNIKFNWVEIGEANSQLDLYDAGLINTPN